MKIKNSRTVLDKWLGDRKLTVLLLIGENDGRKIHDFMIDRLKSWRRCGLITDPSILTTAERTAWGFSDTGGERYVVLGGDPTKSIGAKGTNKSLLRPTGQPSAFDSTICDSVPLRIGSPT